LIQSVDDISKRNTEKVVDNLLRANKSELDVIDKVQKLLEKETANIRNHVNEKLYEEG
jgi:phage gp36-like protein